MRVKYSTPPNWLCGCETAHMNKQIARLIKYTMVALVAGWMVKLRDIRQISCILLYEKIDYISLIPATSAASYEIDSIRFFV